MYIFQCYSLNSSHPLCPLRPLWEKQVALVVKNLPANAGDVRDTSLILGSGRSPGVGNGNQLQYSCLGNSMDREAWWAIVHGATKSQARLSSFIFSPSLAMSISLFSESLAALQTSSSIPFFQIPYTCINIWCFSLSDFLHSRLIHLTATDLNSFIFMAE